MPKPQPPARLRQTDIHVRPRTRKDRPDLRWIVTVPRPGGGQGREKKWFASRDQANAYADLRRAELLSHGTAAAGLTGAERADFLYVRDALKPFGLTVRQAVDELLPQLAARRQTVPVERAVEEFLQAQTRDGRSKRHLQDLRSRLGRFARAFPERPLASLAGAELDQWLRGLSVAALTRNQFRRVVSSLFSFGVTQGWALGNIVAGVAKATVRGADGRSGVLSPDQTAALLANAPADIVAAIAISAFCGLRRAEVERLDWTEVRLSRGHVEVTARKAKSARRRLVPIRENLALWLAPYARASGPVVPRRATTYRLKGEGADARAARETESAFRPLLDEARRAAGLVGKAWPANALRHSFASYHAAHFQDAGKLAAELGHTTPGIVFQHYRELVDPADAARFWQIAPPAAPANVLRMPAERTA